MPSKSTTSRSRRSSSGSSTSAAKAKPKPRRVAKRIKPAAESKGEARTKTIVLAMSPYAANILRSTLGRARHDCQEIHDIVKELEEQLR